MTPGQKRWLWIIIIVLVLCMIHYFLPIRSLFYEVKTVSSNPFRLKSYPVSLKDVPKRRIALCISGQFRYLEHMIDNHSSILSLQPDVFIYAENDVDTKDRSRIMQVYQPKKCIWDTEPTKPYNKLRVNNVKMFRRIYKCDQLRQQYEQEKGFEYDMIIRMRPDLAVYGPFPVELLKKPLKSNRIYFPMRAHKEELLYGLPDMLFMGDRETMKKMCECYLHLDQLTHVDGCPNEYIFMNHMLKQQLIARRFVFPVNNFDRTFHMPVTFMDKYVRTKLVNYVKTGYECYCNNEYEKVQIEDEPKY